MPRQLPWTTKGDNSRTQVKKPPARKQRVGSDTDDEFFRGTVLASSRKGEESAESDDGPLDLPAETLTPRTKSRTGNEFYKERARSSSPPAMAELEPPPTETMQKGISKFELRDDEWMMVEDEFLDTAKLFTRHLHIAEYEKLKQKIEEKKRKKEIQVPRPLVANVKMSPESPMKEQGKVQEKRQKKVVRGVCDSRNAEFEEEAISNRGSLSKAKPAFVGTNRGPPLISRRPHEQASSFTARDIDNDDLDEPNLLHIVSKATSTPKSASAHTANATSAFAKPAPPMSTTRPRFPRASRATPFDMLDDYVVRKSHSTSKSAPEPDTSHASPSLKSAMRSSTLANPSTASSTSKNNTLGLLVDVHDEWISVGMTKETADRLAKRKAGREEQEKEKERSLRKVVKSEEIPTFLF